MSLYIASLQLRLSLWSGNCTDIFLGTWLSLPQKPPPFAALPQFQTSIRSESLEDSVLRWTVPQMPPLDFCLPRQRQEQITPSNGSMSTQIWTRSNHHVCCKWRATAHTLMSNIKGVLAKEKLKRLFENAQKKERQDREEQGREKSERFYGWCEHKLTKS